MGLIIGLLVLIVVLTVVIIVLIFYWDKSEERHQAKIDELKSKNQELVEVAEKEETTKDSIGKLTSSLFQSIGYLKIVREAAAEFMLRAETVGPVYRRWQEVLVQLMEDSTAFLTVMEAIELIHRNVESESAYKIDVFRSDDASHYLMRVPGYPYKFHDGNGEKADEDVAATGLVLLELIEAAGEKATTIHVELPDGSPLNGVPETIRRHFGRS